MRLRMLSLPLAATFVAITVAACGASDGGPGLLARGEQADAAADAATGTNLSVVDAAPTCAALAETSCGCTDVSLIGAQPTLYFVLDASSSMAVDNKWGTVRSVVGEITRKLGDRAYFGAAVLPGPNGATDYCQDGAEVLAPTLGDAPPGTGGATTAALLDALALSPRGSTPTAATLRDLTPELTGRAGPTYVILVTDGGPNCAAPPSCDADDCTTNVESSGSGCTPTSASCCTSARGTTLFCVDETGAVGAIADLQAAQVKTYVVGIPTEARYAQVLDDMAQAGGAARAMEPLFYDVGSDDPSAIEAALLQATADIVGACSLPLTSVPSDPGLVNVLLDGVVVPQDPANGWSLSGSTVTLTGTVCQQVTQGLVLDARVVVGCPVVTR